MARRCVPTRWSWSRDGGKARLLIQTYPLKQKLSRVVEGKPWAASPDTRMMQLLHDTGVRIGLVTNGDQWMLVDAPKGETTGYASWYASLWLEEPKTLQAFRTLLGSYRFFGVPEEETLERLLAQSAQDQQEVTDQLGYQVRQAVEVLVQTIDRANRDSGGALLKGVPEDKLYEAALTVMMRLVFLFCAEERDLLLLGDELYDKNYSVSTLREQLRVTATNFGEEVLERRHDAWSRLLTTFRAVYGGIQHQRLKLPAYKGELFDPDRFPFLEGRTAGTSWKDTPCQPIPVDNRTVAAPPGSPPGAPGQAAGRGTSHAPQAQLPCPVDPPDRARLRGSARPHGGEGDRARAGAERTSGPRARGAPVEARSPGGEGRGRVAGVREGGDGAVVGLPREAAPVVGTGRPDPEPVPHRLPGGREALGADQAVRRAGAARHVRLPGRHPAGERVRHGGDGPPVQRHALHAREPDRADRAVHAGAPGLRGTSRGQAKGSVAAEVGRRNFSTSRSATWRAAAGRFLVQVCIYLAERLLEAWEAAEKRVEGSPRITPYGEVSTGLPEEQLIPLDRQERLTYARRLVAERCVYGVDKNPLAVEMAKLSLWLLTLAKDKPFTFLDHAIRCGDSLVGLSSIDQLLRFSMTENAKVRPLMEQQRQQIEKRLQATMLLRKQIETLPSNTPQDIERKTKMLENVEDQTKRLRYAADMLLAATWEAKNVGELESALNGMLAEVEYKFKDLARRAVGGGSEEAAAKGGDRLVGFTGPWSSPRSSSTEAGSMRSSAIRRSWAGRRSRATWGRRTETIWSSTWPRKRGAPILCAYFLLRAASLAARLRASSASWRRTRSPKAIPERSGSTS